MLRTIVKSQIIIFVNVSKHKIRYWGIHKTLFYNCQQWVSSVLMLYNYLLHVHIIFVFGCFPDFTLIWDFLCCQQTIKFLIADPLQRIKMVCRSSQSFGRNLRKVLLFQRLKSCCEWLGKIDYLKPY